MNEKSPDNQTGDEAAVLYAQYGARLRGLIRREMGWRLRQVEESADIAQSAFHSFLSYMNDQPTTEKQREDLWSLLVAITLNKIRNRAKFWTRQRRDLRRKVTISEASDLLDREPTSDETVALKELIDTLLESFSERRRQILHLILQGCPVGEIAAEVGTTERTVYNTRMAAAEILRKLRAAEQRPE